MSAVTTSPVWFVIAGYICLTVVSISLVVFGLLIANAYDTIQNKRRREKYERH